jgi:hypothetical protein
MRAGASDSLYTPLMSEDVPTAVSQILGHIEVAPARHCAHAPHQSPSGLIVTRSPSAQPRTDDPTETMWPENS